MTNLAQHKQGEENRGSTHIIHNYIQKKEVSVERVDY